MNLGLLVVLGIRVDEVGFLPWLLVSVYCVPFTHIYIFIYRYIFVGVSVTAKGNP